MTIDERIEALTMSLELLSRDREGDRRNIEAQRVTLEAQRMNLEAQRENLDKLAAIVAQDGEHIRALARIAEIHEHRITAIEGGAKEA